MLFKPLINLINLISMISILLLTAAMLLCSNQSFALSMRLAPSAGLMQQPASNYFHAVYGASFDLENQAKTHSLRIHYFERPEFIAQGYADKDYAYHVLYGTKLAASGYHGLYGYFGLGSAEGYVKHQATNRSNFYRVVGLNMNLEYALNFKTMGLFIQHQYFVGVKNLTELKALVVWPFQAFMIGTSFAI